MGEATYECPNCHGRHPYGTICVGPVSDDAAVVQTGLDLAAARASSAQLRADLDEWRRYKVHIEKELANERTMRHGAERERDAALARATQAETKVQDIAKACDEHFARAEKNWAALATAERERDGAIHREAEMLKQCQRLASIGYGDDAALKNAKLLARAEQAERERDVARQAATELLSANLFCSGSCKRVTNKLRALVESWRAAARKERDDG